jgi:DegV family protein with EDD domain
VTVIDSQSLSIGEGMLALAAARAARQGASVADIAALIQDMQRRLHVFITLDTVEFLVRGGRASRLTGLMAGLLKIRPILTMPGGELTLSGRPRGRQLAKQELLKMAQRCFPAESAWVGHIGCADEALELAAGLSHLTGFPQEQLAPVETGMVLASHGGPGTLGIVVVSK